MQLLAIAAAAAAVIVRRLLCGENGSARRRVLYDSRAAGATDDDKVSTSSHEYRLGQTSLIDMGVHSRIDDGTKPLLVLQQQLDCHF